MKNLPFTVLIFLILSSCNSHFKPGVYKAYSKNNYHYIRELTLNNDSSYNYSLYAVGHYDLISYGKWQLSSKGRKIILNHTYDKLDSLDITVTEYSVDSIDGYKFYLDHDWYQIIFWTLNQRDVMKVFENGETFMSDIGSDGFHIKARVNTEQLSPIPQHQWLYSKIYKPKNLSSNVFIIKFDDSIKQNIIYYVPPSTSVIKIKNKNTLIWQLEHIKEKLKRQNE